jgi:hypothetical protein
MMDSELEKKLKASFGKQLAIGSIKENPRLIDIRMAKKKDEH